MSKEIRPKKSYTIQLTTLTPVCIGNGGKMVSTSDYVFDKANKQIHYINKEAVAQKLADHDELMDKYIQGIIHGMDNNTTHFDLKNFLEKTLSLSPKEYISYSVTANIKSAKDLNTIIKDAKGNPYIPGSTIKGALKNAMAYNNLKSQSIITNQLRKLIEELYSNFEKSKGKQIINLQMKRSEKKAKIKELDIEIRNRKEEIEGFKEAGISKNQYQEEIYDLEIIESALKEEKAEYYRTGKGIKKHLENWKKNSDIEQKFKKLEITSAKENPTISDSNTISNHHISIVDTKRIHLFKDSNISYILESIIPNSKTEFSLKWEEKERISLKQLFRQVNEFSIKNIDLDLFFLGEATNPSNDTLKVQFKKIREEIKQLTDKQCILRLGFNKGVYFNSILNVFYEIDKKVFYKLLVLLGYKEYKKELKDVIFPLTRGITPESTLGWVKLEII